MIDARIPSHRLLIECTTSTKSDFYNDTASQVAMACLLYMDRDVDSNSDDDSDDYEDDETHTNTAINASVMAVRQSNCASLQQCVTQRRNLLMMNPRYRLSRHRTMKQSSRAAR
jgi:hypothetical protein